MALQSRLVAFSATAITAVVVGGGMFAPASARAECGNYIVYTNPAHRPLTKQPTGDHQAPMPCRGPHCSQMPPSAPMQAPPSLRNLADDPVVALSQEVLVPPSLEPLSADSESGDVVRRPTDIFHPPR